MKINQEEFNKLNQLDRIEYRLCEDRAKERYKGGNTMSMIYLVIGLTMFYILLMVCVYNMNHETYYRLAERLPFVFAVFMVGIFLSAFLDIVLSMKLYKTLEELQRRFFKIETNKEIKK